MSSFLVSKVDYIKCAGFIAGIAESFNKGGRQEFFLYDTVAKKNTDTELFYKRFVQCYDMNADSMVQQYGYKAKVTDNFDYRNEFNAYFVKGKGLIHSAKENQIQAIADVQKFFRGSLYQVENERYAFLMEHWFNQILDRLNELFIYRFYESSNWGSFDLTSEQENVTA